MVVNSRVSSDSADEAAIEQADHACALRIGFRDAGGMAWAMAGNAGGCTRRMQVQPTNSR